MANRSTCLNYGMIEDAYPLSHLQAGMYFHSVYGEETAVYHDIFGLHIRGPFNKEALQLAAKEIVERHPVLRTSFDFDRFSEPLQLVHKQVPINVQVEDLRTLSPSEQETAMAVWSEHERRSRFDIAQPPLFRLQIHRTNDEEFVLTLTFHHSILDGWSVAVLVSEMLQHYLALMGKPVPLLAEPPAIRFSRLIELERNAIVDLKTQKFWKEYLQGHTVNELPRLPISRPQEEIRYAGGHYVSLEAQLSELVRDLAYRCGVPIKTVLLAAHVRVMAMLNSESDVVTGLVVNTRPEEAGADRVLGLFLNTLPVRLQADGGTWEELIRLCYRAEQDIMPFRYYPLAEIQKVCGNRSLFETAFNFAHFHVYETLRDCGSLEVMGGSSYEATNFTLLSSFDLDTRSSHLGLRLIYDEEQLSYLQVELIGNYYLAALRRMTQDPLARYRAESLLTLEERRCALHGWNATEREYSRERCIQELIAEQAKRTPGAIAVKYEGEEVTYEELNRRTNQLAGYLRRYGVGPDERVGICMDRSVEMVVGLLGILKAGGAYVPLEPGYPQERLGQMVRDAGLRVVVTRGDLVSKLPECGVPVVSIDREWERIREESEEGVESGVGGENLAYVMYTSGSTGEPKGVMIRQAGVVNRLEWMQREYGLESGDRVLQKTPFSFDVSVWEFFWPLMVGARLVVVRPEGHKDPGYLREVMAREEITTVHFVPSMLQAYLGASEGGGWGSVKRVVCSGEALTRELVEEFYERGGQGLHNLYGPTEASIDVSYWACERDGGKGSSVPIGRPIANTQMYVLDEEMEPVAVGVKGEIYIGGAGLARGYVNRGDLTGERFVPNPYSKEGGERLYRTGDVGRYLRGGEIEYVGRKDGQVKVRGYRIELGEIEAVVGEHEGVREAVVEVREDRAGEKRLVAYYTCTSENAVDAEQLRTHLAATLPDYMVPAAYVRLEAMPLTANGKLDRKAFPAPEADAYVVRGYEAPQGEIETKLAEIWADVLKVERVGRKDNFFELGGHSLLAVKLIERMRGQGLAADVHALFATSTLAELASAVGSEGRVVEVPPNRIPEPEQRRSHASKSVELRV